MIKYNETTSDIIKAVEIDLTEVSDKDTEDLDKRITQYLKYIGSEYKSMYKYDKGDKLIYETEILIPRVNKNGANLLIVLGNPAVHSVHEKMFFSYENTRIKGKWKEHRFWKALRYAGILEFNEDLESPTPDNLEKINYYKRESLLNRTYKSCFNIFLLTYFSLPTPASGKYSGVAGIKEAVGEKILEEMKKFEAQRFKRIVTFYGIKNLICFHKVAYQEIKTASCKPVNSYHAGSTRLILTDKSRNELRHIVSDIKTKNSDI